PAPGDAAARRPRPRWWRRRTALEPGSRSSAALAVVRIRWWNINNLLLAVNARPGDQRLESPLRCWWSIHIGGDGVSNQSLRYDAAPARREAILERVHARGFCSVAELAGHL